MQAILAEAQNVYEEAEELMEDTEAILNPLPDFADEDQCVRARHYPMEAQALMQDVDREVKVAQGA